MARRLGLILASVFALALLASCGYASGAQPYVVYEAPAAVQSAGTGGGGDTTVATSAALPAPAVIAVVNEVEISYPAPSGSTGNPFLRIWQTGHGEERSFTISVLPDGDVWLDGLNVSINGVEYCGRQPCWIRISGPAQLHVEMETGQVSVAHISKQALAADDRDRAMRAEGNPTWDRFVFSYETGELTRINN